MPDFNPQTRTPLDRLVMLGRFGANSTKPGLIIEERTDLGLATVMTRRGEAQNLNRAVAAAYGLDLPDGPQLAAKDGISFGGIGVGKWLAAAEGPAASNFVPLLRQRLAGLASITDHSDGRVVLRLSGHSVRAVLAKGIPIDLHPRGFKTGDIASTLVAHIGVQIQQLDDRPTYELMAFRSFASSLWSWLIKSAAEYGYEITSTPVHG